MGIDSFKMKEAESGKVFDIVVLSRPSEFSIKAQDKNLTYSEDFTIINDTFYLRKRFIKIGLISANLTYSPRRIRMVLPFAEKTSWFYSGTETGLGYKRRIESKGYMNMVEETIFIYNVSIRDGREDTSMVAFDKDYNLYKITIQIPDIFGIYRILGFKSQNILLMRETK